MKKNELNQKQRIIAATVYFAFLCVVFTYITGDLSSFLFVANVDSKICFMTGALLLILGNFIVEPYFTKPADSIINSVAVIIALMGLSEPNILTGYKILRFYAIGVLIISILSIAFKDTKNGKVLYSIVELIGKAKVIFSFVYLMGIYSYYGKHENIIEFIVLLAYWMIIMYVHIVEIIILRISSVFSILKSKGDEPIGYAIGCDNPLLFKIEISSNRSELNYGDLVLIEKKDNLYNIGVVIHKKNMLDKYWVEAYMISDNSSAIIIKGDELFGDEINHNTSYPLENGVSKLNFDNLKTDIQDIVVENELYKNRNEFIGFVTVGSDINTINFTILRDDYLISEGVIIKSSILGNETLFQVINGITNIEMLEQHNHHGYLVGIARKLGAYNDELFELNTSKWVPNMYSPVFGIIEDRIEDEELKSISDTCIGRLPSSNYRIPLNDISSLVTHNTAILGILGIGKSCLAFESIKKVTDQGIKVICIDITNQYKNVETGLPTYIDSNKIKTEISDENLKVLRGSKSITGNQDKPKDWGNTKLYHDVLDIEIGEFIEDHNKSVFILNPDWHPVSQAATKFKVNELVDLTVAEKCRLITERIFMNLLKKGETTEARVWVVYEEAHSLIPEWNSVANEGDKTATNGTSKVILQGKEVWFGTCQVITQRTANISKSILNQCNTIFALRIFDDTGKNFLENYIGKEYSSTLPTLEERHAIAIGKGLKLKQPVIVQLNDRKYFVSD